MDFKLNSLQFNQNLYGFKSNSCAQKPQFALNVLKEDVISFSGAKKKKAPVVWDERKVEKVYNSVYESVLEQIPLTEELYMQKPVIYFDDECRGELAAYNVLTNAITLSPDLKGDLYIFSSVDKDTKKIKDIIAIEGQEQAAGHQYFVALDPETELIKLTDKEKERVVAALIAHELRHCVQEHLALSADEEYGRKTCMDAMKFQDEFKMWRLYRNCPEDKLKFANRQIGLLDYMVNYEPKKPLDKDTVLKFSTDPNDRRYLSVCKHLVRQEGKTTVGEEAIGLPQEVDAYNFEAEFFKNSLTKKNALDGTRPEVINALIQFNERAVFKCYEEMEKGGFEPFIVK